MPLGFVAIFYELGRDLDPSHNHRLGFRVVALAILVIASLGLIGDVCERAQILHSGFALPAAREKFAVLRMQYPQARIALHRFLFTLTENRRQITFVIWPVPPPDADLFVVPQAYLGFAEPPAINGYQVVENFFNPRHARFLGIPLWTRDRGCGFAVYARH